MSVEVWPTISPAELEEKRGLSRKNELEWIVEEVRETLKDTKHGLEDCYALLAPIDPGSTLVMSTARSERVKGHVTRVGTRIVKGTLHLQLRTLPPQTIAIDTARPIHVTPLIMIQKHIDEAITVVAKTLSCPLNAPFISAQLRILSQLLSDTVSTLKGPPLTESDPTWTSLSCAASHFSPKLSPSISIHLGLQESCLVLWLRSLEPVDAPVHFGTKLGLALGAVRRIEHDEMDTVFTYCPNTEDLPKEDPYTTPNKRQDPIDVFVREKVRLESPDPNLILLHAKINSLRYTLAQTRKNIGAVLGEEVMDE